MAAHSIKHAANIDRLRIATPCPISWEQMTGNSRVRFCGNGQLNVYNISELSRSEAEALIASTEGRLCARLFRRADGTILTNVETKETRKTSTNVAGRFEFASLAAGNYSITIETEAFKTYRVLNVDVEKDRLIDLNMILELHGEALIGVVALPDLFDTTPGTTIMSGDLIRKLPIQ